MKKMLLSFLVLIISISIFSSPLINNLRFSAVTDNNLIGIRGELDFFYDISFYYESNGLWQYETFDYHDDINTYQAFIPAPDDNPVHVGIRAYNDVISELDAGVAIQPVPWTNQGQPQANNLNWLVNDTEEDASVDETFLDILSTHFTYNDEKLFFAIRNNGGGFPVSEAIWGPFYSYISLIIPNDISFMPFGLLYTVNQAGIVQPGLYKITGTEMTDIELVGNIESFIDQDNNLLILSCNWSDLYADADFNSWFDPDNPTFSTVSGTGMITLTGGMQETDYTYPAVIFLEDLTLEEEENILPVISQIQVDHLEGNLSFTYYDANANYPLTAQAIIDNSITLYFQPTSYDYSQEVIFERNGISELLLGNWEEITFTVSDNNIEYITENIHQTPNHDSYELSSLTNLSNYPNPFNPETTISFELRNASQVKIDVFNIKGQKITSLEDDHFSKGKHQTIWQGKDINNKTLPSGVYYLRLQTDKQKIIHKMILMK